MTRRLSPCRATALTRFDLEERPESELAACIGPPIDAVFTRLAGRDSKELVAALIARYRERFSDVGYSENTLYCLPEPASTIARVPEPSFALGLVTGLSLLVWLASRRGREAA